MARGAPFQTFERDLQLATAGIAPENISRELAKFAKSELARAIAEKSASPIYERFVNGRHGEPEESVIAPGPILYVFSWWEPVITFALDYLRRHSPVGPSRNGHYRDSHIIMIGGQQISSAANIAPGEEVIVVNTQPYSRKIESGHMNMSVDRGVYLSAARAVKRQFGGAFDVKDTQITIPGGYVLKGRFRRGFRQFARKKLRKDTAAGARMTYPALIMRMN